MPICDPCATRCNAALEKLTSTRARAPAWLRIDERYRHGHRESAATNAPPSITGAQKRLVDLVAGGGAEGTLSASSSTGHSPRSSAPSSPRSRPTRGFALLQSIGRRGGVQQASKFDIDAADIYALRDGVWSKVGFGKPQPADAYVPLAPVPRVDIASPELHADLCARLETIAAQRRDGDGDDGSSEPNQLPTLLDLLKTTGHIAPSTTPENPEALAIEQMRSW
jgi:hypothetical protein